MAIARSMSNERIVMGARARGWGRLGAVLADDFDVPAVEGWPSALAELAEQDIIVVVTDEEMPGRRGLALLAYMPRRFALVVGALVTAHAENASSKETMRDPHCPTLVIKPYDPDVLLHRMRNAAIMAGTGRASVRLRATAGAGSR